MSKNLSPLPNPFYEIRIAGRIDPVRAAWFGDWELNIEQPVDGGVTTVLLGQVADQAALFGLISQVRDLGLKLLSVNQIFPGDTSSSEIRMV